MAPVRCSHCYHAFLQFALTGFFVLSSLASFHCIFLLDTCWPSSILPLLFLHSSHHTFTSPYTMAYASTTLTMHPLWMNPPTPMFAPIFQQQQQHIYLTVPDNIQEAQSIYSFDEPTNVPDWQPLPGTTPLFGSCRRVRLRKVDTCTSGDIFERDVEYHTSSAMPRQLSKVQHTIPRKPVPSCMLPSSGPPPDKPLPPVPTLPALAAKPKPVPLPGSVPVPASITIPAPASASVQPPTTNKLSTKVSQYLKMPSLTSNNSSSTLKSFQSSRSLPYNPLPPIPQSSLFDLATKKTTLVRCHSDDSDEEEDEVQDGGLWSCLRLFSCFGGCNGTKVKVGGDRTALVGGVRKLTRRNTLRGRQTSRPVSVAFPRTISSAHSTRPPSSSLSSLSSMIRARSSHSIRYSTSSKRTSRLGVSYSTSRSTKRFSSLSLSRHSTRLSFYADTDDASPPPSIPDDIVWKSKVTSRHADEGRYLPFISIQATTSLPSQHPCQRPGTNTSTTATASATTTSQRTHASHVTSQSELATAKGTATAFVTSASVQAWLQLHRNVSVYRGVERTQELRLKGLVRAGVRVV